LKNHNPGQRPAALPSIISILKAISDDKALVLFNSIAVSNKNVRYIPLKELNLSAKQYYSRISGLLNAGLIKRHKAIYSLTLLGKIVYDSQMIVGKALSYYWRLKTIEFIDMFGPDLPAEEITQLIDALIDNHQIKDILMKLASVSSIETTPMIQVSTPAISETQSLKDQRGTGRVI
jgi:DNA-binding Lrp family transcriptional regulator